MNQNDAPRLPKWAFFLGDVVLLVFAWLIANYLPHPFTPLPFISTVVCVVLGTALFIVPFLVDEDRRKQAEATDLRQELDTQSQRMQAATEQLSHALAQLKVVDEASIRAFHAAEKLPQRLQEKVAEFKQQLEIAEDEEKESMTQELATLRSAETD